MNNRRNIDRYWSACAARQSWPATIRASPSSSSSHFGGYSRCCKSRLTLRRARRRSRRSSARALTRDKSGYLLAQRPSSSLESGRRGNAGPELEAKHLARIRDRKADRNDTARLSWGLRASAAREGRPRRTDRRKRPVAREKVGEGWGSRSGGRGGSLVGSRGRNLVYSFAVGSRRLDRARCAAGIRSGARRRMTALSCCSQRGSR